VNSGVRFSDIVNGSDKLIKNRAAILRLRTSYCGYEAPTTTAQRLGIRDEESYKTQPQKANQFLLKKPRLRSNTVELRCLHQKWMATQPLDERV
jgi:hypothetical protein